MAARIQIPGVTPDIIGAGIQGLRKGYLASFQVIWITAAAFSFVAALRKSAKFTLRLSTSFVFVV